MKILQLCKKVPFPLKDGESVAIYTLSKGLANSGCDISLLAFNTSKHFIEWDTLPKELAHYSSITTISLDTKISYWRAFVNIWETDKSYNIERFVSNLFSEKLIELIDATEYDLIQLETLYLAPYIDVIKSHSKAKVIMRSHNIESEIWHNLASQSRSRFKSWYYELCGSRLEQYEKRVHDKYDLLLPITIQDALKYEAYGYSGLKYVVPIGLETSKYFPRKKEISNKIKIGYIGSLDWKPNIEGLDWFLLNHWEHIAVQFPNLEFHLAGRNPGERYQIDLPRFVMHGEVDSAIEFIDSLDILLVPLFSGSGMRVKILEGMILSKVVISTPKGFEGIGISHNENALCYENIEDLILCLQNCCNNASYLVKLGQKARQFVIKEFDYNAVANGLKEMYHSLKETKLN